LPPHWGPGFVGAPLRATHLDSVGAALDVAVQLAEEPHDSVDDLPKHLIILPILLDTFFSLPDIHDTTDSAAACLRMPNPKGDIGHVLFDKSSVYRPIDI